MEQFAQSLKQDLEKEKAEREVTEGKFIKLNAKLNSQIYNHAQNYKQLTSQKMQDFDKYKRRLSSDSLQEGMRERLNQ